MAANIEVNLVLKRLAESSSEIKKFSSDAAKSVQGIENQFKNLQRIALAALGVVGFKELINAAVGQENAITKLNVALKLSGDFSEEASLSFQRYADQLQATTGVEDDAILNQIALTKAFGLTDQQSKELIKTAIDLSAITGDTLATSVDQLQKSYAGNAKELSVNNLELKNLTKEQLLNGDAVKILGEKYKGAAESLTNTFSGAARLSAVSAGELAESLGGLIVQNPFIVKAIKDSGKVFLEIQKVIEDNKTTIMEFINSGLSGILSLVPLIIKAVSVMDVVFTAFVETIKIASAATAALVSVVTTLSLAGAKEIDAQSKADVEKSQADLAKRIALAEQLSGVTEKYIGALDNAKKAGIKLTTAEIKASEERLKAVQKLIEAEQLRARIQEEQRKFVEKAASDPFRAFTAAPVLPEGATQKDIDKASSDAKIAGGAGLANELLKGQAGASKLISQGVGLIADTLIPGIGGIVSQIVGVLAQGPEAVRGFVQAFIDSVPIIVENIILSLPVIVETLANGLGPMVEKTAQALIDSMPGVAASLAAQAPFIALNMSNAIAARAPFIAIEFTAAFVRDGVPAIVRGFIEQIKAQATSFGGLFGGGGGGGVLGSIGGALGFADGGVVPKGFPNDNFPASLTSGELIVDRSDTARLSRFLDDQQSSDSVSALSKKFDQLMRSMGGGQPLSVNLDVGEQQLANVNLNLNRQGFRK